MDFLRLPLLWGLAAAALPILIHLLGRRRVRPVPLATLRFLRRAQARASARLKLRRILLLAARIGVLAALALLYSGPGCLTPRAEPGARTWAIVMDNSPSMAAAEGGEPVLERGRRELLRLLADAAPEDLFHLSTTALEPPSHRDGSRGMGPDEARRAVREVAIRYGAHSVGTALERVLTQLRGTPRTAVVLVTDLQAAGWSPETLTNPDDTPLQILDVGLPTPRNTWIDEIEVAEGEETTARIEVRLGHSGASPEEPYTVRVSLADGSRMTAFVENGQAVFQGRLPSGLSVARAEVVPGGDLALDDELPAVVGGRSRTRVLLVNGDPRGFEIRDELLFVRQAFARSSRLEDRLRVEEVRIADLDPERFGEADAVLLANPGPLSERLTAALLRYVEGGGGLVVTAGDRWQLETPRDIGTEVLAAPPRDVVRVPPDDPSRPPFEVLDLASLRGPMADFDDEQVGDLGAVRVNQYWVLDARAGEDLEVWMRLENGAPLLVERRIGRGRSLLLATTVDRDAADLCLQPVFIPWLEHLLLHAAGSLREPLPRSVEVGQSLPLPYEEPVQVRYPDGRERDWNPAQPNVRAEEPGAHVIVSRGKPVDGFVARLQPAESDLRRLRPEELDQRLGAGNYVLGRGSEVAARGPGAGRRDVSSWVALALALFLAGEALLSTRWQLHPRREALEVEP